MNKRADLLCWADVETTGLDPDKGVLLEVAVMLTDQDLVPVAPSCTLVIGHDRQTIKALMDDTVLEMHCKSGLLADCSAAGVQGCTVEKAEAVVLQELERYCLPGTAPLCGNTINFDRAWLARYMPRLAAFVHYRNIDVTTVKRLAAMWRPDVSPAPKANAHRACEDVFESIAELRYWRDHWLRS